MLPTLQSVEIEYQFKENELHIAEAFINLLKNYHYKFIVVNASDGKSKIVSITIEDTRVSGQFVVDLRQAAANLAIPPKPTKLERIKKAVYIAILWLLALAGIAMIGSVIWTVFSLVLYPFSKIFEFIYG